jgi:aminoglycoside phosphotransferase (APT) family kinase protein
VPNSSPVPGAVEAAPSLESQSAGVQPEELFSWIESELNGRVVSTDLASGGNRCQGWLVDVETRKGREKVFLRYQVFESPQGGPYAIRREAELYAALGPRGVAIAGLRAVHPKHQAMVLSRLDGSGQFASLSVEDRGAVSDQAMSALADLHRVDASDLDLPSFGKPATVREAVQAEIDIWRKMYLSTGRRDPLIEFGHTWLSANLPDVSDPPVVVHGDAGPGNVMFEGGSLTGLIDWELAHLGDPMEDVAWYSMRTAIEPVPDFPARVRAYEARAGRPIDVARVRYHQAFVCWRVVIIRHCNVSGAVGASILMRALNRRLFVEAVAKASGISLPPVRDLEEAPVRGAYEFDRVLETIRDEIVPDLSSSRVIAKTKDIARAIKYLRRVQACAADAERLELESLSSLLGVGASTVDTGRLLLTDRLNARAADHVAAIQHFHVMTQIETQLARDAMGAMAKRSLPKLRETE